MTKIKKNNSIERRYVIDELNAEDSRRLLNIMGEFIDGFTLFSNVPPMVSVFGSSRADSQDKYYNMAVKLGARLAEAGVGALTGGGPGIMEAANKGAYEAGGVSAGVAIDLPKEQDANEFTTHGISVRHFFVRKVLLIKYSFAFVIFPGGFGTFDELFEALTLIRTNRIVPFPVILVGTEFWAPMTDWLRSHVAAAGYVDREDVETIRLTDDLDEVVRICSESIERSRKSEWMKKKEE